MEAPKPEEAIIGDVWTDVEATQRAHDEGESLEPSGDDEDDESAAPIGRLWGFASRAAASAARGGERGGEGGRVDR